MKCQWCLFVGGGVGVRGVLALVVLVVLVGVLVVLVGVDNIGGLIDVVVLLLQLSVLF